MHFMLGGAVKGQKYYGVPPMDASDGPDDVDQGRPVPTTLVDQYAATLEKWTRASDTDLHLSVCDRSMTHCFVMSVPYKN